MKVTSITSTAYHPETDGQTERVNSVINQYLRVFCSYAQDDWVALLATAEFSYNNTIHTATGTTPFFANTGRHPKFDQSPAVSVTDTPNVLAERLNEVTDFVKENLQLAREDMKCFADTSRKEAPKYLPGDNVMLSTKNIRTSRPKEKWSDKYIGPYKVVREVRPGAEAYLLDLPKSMKIHPVFHTSLLVPPR